MRRFSDRRGPRGGGALLSTGKGTLPQSYGVGTGGLPVLGGSGTGTALYDPSVLNLAIWNRNYGGASPWAGTASAGSSGTRSLTEGTNPPAAGAALNGQGTASFNGTSSKIGIATFINSNAANLIGASTSAAYSGWALVNVTALGTNGADYNNQCIVSTGPSAYFCVYLKSGSGGQVGVANFDGAREVTPTAIGTGAWALVQWKLDSGTLKIRVNGGTRSTIAAGALSAPNGFQLGYQPNDSAHYYNGLIAEFALMGSTLSDAQEDNVKSYINGTYGLSL